jgi:hypothetical protein
MPVTSAGQMHQHTSNRHQAGAPRVPRWNWVAMGQVGLTGWTRLAAKPVARAVARRTGRPEAQILSLVGAGFLAISLIDFLRQVDAVIAAGRPAPSASQGRPAGRRHRPAGRAGSGSKGQQPG